MAFSKRPTFLKRQKEQQRLARATSKREERLARKRAKHLGVAGADVDDLGRPEDVGLDRPDDEQSLISDPAEPGSDGEPRG